MMQSDSRQGQLDWHLLHSVLRHGDPSADPNQWTWYPTVIVGTALFLAIYLYGVGPLRQRHQWADRWPTSRVVLFVIGTMLFLLSLVSPLDVLSDKYLLSAHMVQHMLLAMVVPPLWLLGTPEWLIRPLIKPVAVARLARILTQPVVAIVLFNLTFWLWHWPALYELAVDDETVHSIQHLSFVVTAVLNWWPVLSPLPELPRLNYPLRVLYLFADCQPGVALGALLVFSRDVLYRSYVDSPRLFGLSPYTDQQIGGLIMWIPGNGIYLLVMSIVSLIWLQQGERATRDHGKTEPLAPN